MYYVIIFAGGALIFQHLFLHRQLERERGKGERWREMMKREKAERYLFIGFKIVDYHTPAVI